MNPKEKINGMNVGIITVSDRASAGEYEDHGGPALQAESEKRDWHVLADAIVPDDKERIKEAVSYTHLTLPTKRIV